MSEIESLRAEIAAMRQEQGFLLTAILAAVQQGVRVAALQRDNTYRADYDRPFTVAAPLGASPAIDFAEAMSREHSARLRSPCVAVRGALPERLPVVGDIASLHQAVKDNPAPGIPVSAG